MAFDSSPSVRIPDGSLVRILIAALSEALRVACFRARVRLTAQGAGLAESSWAALPRFPSLALLHSAKEKVTKQQPPPPCFFIVHANPTMPDDIRDVPSDVAAALIPESCVLSLDEFRVHCYAPKPP